jgi:hypothetical protein
MTRKTGLRFRGSLVRGTTSVCSSVMSPLPGVATRCSTGATGISISGPDLHRSIPVAPLCTGAAGDPLGPHTSPALTGRAARIHRSGTTRSRQTAPLLTSFIPPGSVTYTIQVSHRVRFPPSLLGWSRMNDIGARVHVRGAPEGRGDGDQISHSDGQHHRTTEEGTT